MIQLDGKTLNVSHLTENMDAVATETDAWENEQYKKKLRVFGVVKTWALECYEENIAWNDSAVKHLQTKAKSGDAVSFVVDEGNIHQVNCNVYILSVNLTYEGGIPSHRIFSISLHEAM